MVDGERLSLAPGERAGGARRALRPRRLTCRCTGGASPVRSASGRSRPEMPPDRSGQLIGGGMSERQELGRTGPAFRSAASILFG